MHNGFREPFIKEIYVDFYHVTEFALCAVHPPGPNPNAEKRLKIFTPQGLEMYTKGEPCRFVDSFTMTSHAFRGGFPSCLRR